MNFATTGDERTPEALAARIFGTPVDAPETKRAANALVRANPLLARLEALPPTVITVPDVRGVEPAEAPASLPAAASSLLLGAALTHVEEIADAAGALAKENTAAARAYRKGLDAAELRRRAREDKQLGAWVREARLEADAEVEEARALAKEQKAAIAELADDLTALLEVIG